MFSPTPSKLWNSTVAISSFNINLYTQYDIALIVSKIQRKRKVLVINWSILNTLKTVDVIFVIIDVIGVFVDIFWVVTNLVHVYLKYVWKSYWRCCKKEIHGKVFKDIVWWTMMLPVVDIQSRGGTEIRVERHLRNNLVVSLGVLQILKQSRN